MEVKSSTTAAAATATFALARALCAGCASYHGIFPFLRLARVVGGSASTHAMWDSVTTHVARGARRILIAGAGDDANARRALAAIGARGDARLEISDICETPLLALRHGELGEDSRIVVRQADMLDPDERRFDLIIADRLTSFVPRDQRALLVRRLHRRLLAGGHLLISDLVDEILVGDGDPGPPFAQQSLARLEELGVALPEPRALFTTMLEHYGRDRAARTRDSLTPAEMHMYLSDAGFASVSVQEMDTQGGGSVPAAPIRRGRRLLFDATAPDRCRRP